MKRQNYGPRLGKLVFQLSGDVTLAYDLRLTRSIALGFPKKCCLGPQNGFGSSGPEKLLKIVSCAENEKMKETMVGPQVE